MILGDYSDLQAAFQCCKNPPYGDYDDHQQNPSPWSDYDEEEARHWSSDQVFFPDDFKDIDRDELENNIDSDSAQEENQDGVDNESEIHSDIGTEKIKSDSGTEVHSQFQLFQYYLYYMGPPSLIPQVQPKSAKGSPMRPNKSFSSIEDLFSDSFFTYVIHYYSLF